MGVIVGAATDLGLRRADNEDSLGYWIPEEDVERERGILLVVADGMGGSLAGEVASQLAVETVLTRYRNGPGDRIDERLARCVHEANRIVHARSLSDPALRGMGTTCTVVAVRERETYFAHVGDSRVYLVRDSAIRQVTRDHSLVAQLVEAHQITPEEARVDPRRNVVTRSVGVAADVEVDAERMDGELRDGDTLVLCTDGLHGLVEDAEIARIASGGDLDAACKGLIALARERGGYDNISLILARYEGRGGGAKPVTWTGPERNWDRDAAQGGSPIMGAKPSVTALHLFPSHGAPGHAVGRVQALENTGLEGDHHARPGSRRQVLLVEHEVLDTLGLSPGQIREQITVRGLRLNELEVGTRLRAGEAVLEVAGPCKPCSLMDEIRSGLQAELEGRRGRFVRVVTPGSFGVGDPLTVET
jgi:serine/threonine protein phosphatase PrpC